MVPKAPLRSRRAAPTACPSPTERVTLSWTEIGSVERDLPFMNPRCLGLTAWSCWMCHMVALGAWPGTEVGLRVCSSPDPPSCR